MGEVSQIINIVDVVIVLLILMFGVIGLKRGFFKEVAISVGVVLVFILAFYLKDPLANFLSLNLPFFQFKGAFEGLTALNIVLYQLIAFIVLLIILLAILNVVIAVTGVFEKILKFTIILGIPSKILGMIVGFIEGYIIVFVALFFLSQPAFNITIINQSTLTPKILNSTPGLSNIVGDLNQTMNDIYELGKKFETNKDPNQFNLETVDTMLKHHIVKTDYIEKLIDKGKLKITGIDSVLNKYR